MGVLKDSAMRKWYVPMTVAGLGGLGLLLASDWGRNALRRLRRSMQAAPGALREFNCAVEGEITRLQESVDELARAIRPATE